MKMKHLIICFNLVLMKNSDSESEGETNNLQVNIILPPEKDDTQSH